MSTHERTQAYVGSVVTKINNSVSLLVLVLGILFLASAAVLQTGVIPALLGIWGAALVVLGTVCYAIMWQLRR